MAATGVDRDDQERGAGKLREGWRGGVGVGKFLNNLTRSGDGASSSDDNSDTGPDSLDQDRTDGSSDQDRTASSDHC